MFIVLTTIKKEIVKNRGLYGVGSRVSLPTNMTRILQRHDFQVRTSPFSRTVKISRHLSLPNPLC